jgi:hypothetical protein
MLVLLASLGVTWPAIADEDCNVPMTDWQPRDALQRMAEKQSWTVRRIKIDDGCYKIDGLDAQGRTIEATVDPATLAILSLEYAHDDRGEPGTWEPSGASSGNDVTVPGREPETGED